MSGIGKLADRLRALADTPSVIAGEAASIIKKHIEAEFDFGNDPYGRPWKPLKRGGVSRLQETGVMKGSLTVKVNGTSIEIAFSDYKVVFHQATRPILTIGVMPVTWSQAIEDAFSKVMKR